MQFFLCNNIFFFHYNHFIILDFFELWEARHILSPRLLLCIWPLAWPVVFYLKVSEGQRLAASLTLIGGFHFLLLGVRGHTGSTLSFSEGLSSPIWSWLIHTHHHWSIKLLYTPILSARASYLGRMFSESLPITKHLCDPQRWKMVTILHIYLLSKC